MEKKRPAVKKLDKHPVERIEALTDIFFDPETGIVVIGDTDYQLRNARNRCKITFNHKGELQK